MAYYLTVESKRGATIPLEIKDSIYFQIVKRKYEKACAYSLDEIDSFTMMFNNESELRNALICEGILPLELRNKKLSIRFLKNGKYQKIRYDFLYQKDLEYIANPESVVEEIMKRYYQNDFVFLQKFAYTFSNYHECSTTAPEVSQSSAISIREGRRHYLLESVDKNGDLLVARLVKLLILKHTESFDGTIHYKDEVNYRNLHAVIGFINHYDKKLFAKDYQLIQPTYEESEIETQSIQPIHKEHEIENEPAQISFSDLTEDTNPRENHQTINAPKENIPENIQVRTKTRSRKKIEVLDGQLSFII